jgi:hypothetical protein
MHTVTLPLGCNSWHEMYMTIYWHDTNQVYEGTTANKQNTPEINQCSVLTVWNIKLSNSSTASSMGSRLARAIICRHSHHKEISIIKHQIHNIAGYSTPNCTHPITNNLLHHRTTFELPGGATDSIDVEDLPHDRSRYTSAWHSSCPCHR